jgi:hypothetical protein
MISFNVLSFLSSPSRQHEQPRKSYGGQGLVPNSWACDQVWNDKNRRIPVQSLVLVHQLTSHYAIQVYNSMFLLSGTAIKLE